MQVRKERLLFLAITVIVIAVGSTRAPSNFFPLADMALGAGETGPILIAHSPQDECDALASNPLDPNRPPGVSGVVIGKIDATKAEAACRAALKADPKNPRFNFQLGRSLEAAKSFSEAATAYQQASNLGYAAAAYNLGLSYAQGKGVAKDETKATELYQKATNLNYAPAITALGTSYRFGRGASKDEAKAVGLYRRAAEMNYAPAITNLAICYSNGFGTAKNEIEAARLYQKAADSGEVIAIANLGAIYRDGRGVPKDSSKAAELTRQAAEKDNTWAMVNLGVMYERGDGVPKNLIVARNWYEKAVARGEKRAEKYLTRLVALGEECLRFKNHSTHLSQGEVYENGKLKFRIDGWRVNHTDADGWDVGRSLQIKSNAPKFNGRWNLGDRDDGIQLSDGQLCLGREITANCTYDRYWVGNINAMNPWLCRFSEF